MSISHWQNSLNRPLLMLGWSLRQTLPIWNLFSSERLLVPMNLAKGTVRSYLRDRSSPPQSSKSQMSLPPSSPYFPRRVSLSSKMGVSISEAPCYLQISLMVLMTWLLMIIYNGSVSLVPFGTLGLICSVSFERRRLLVILVKS